MCSPSPPYLNWTAACLVRLQSLFGWGSAVREYSKAILRGVLPVDSQTGQQGLSFELGSGEIVRVMLDLTCAESLKTCLSTYQGYHFQRLAISTASQSEISSGNSSSDGSPQDGQNDAPVTKSSTAGVGNE